MAMRNRSANWSMMAQQARAIADSLLPLGEWPYTGRSRRPGVAGRDQHRLAPDRTGRPHHYREGDHGLARRHDGSGRRDSLPSSRAICFQADRHDPRRRVPPDLGPMCEPATMKSVSREPQLPHRQRIPGIRHAVAIRPSAVARTRIAGTGHRARAGSRHDRSGVRRSGCRACRRSAWTTHAHRAGRKCSERTREPKAGHAVEPTAAPANRRPSFDTGGEFRRRWGANKSRAMTFACNNDSRQSRLRVFSIFLASAAGKHSRIAPRNSSV
jgi:hypothetical protein